MIQSKTKSKITYNTLGSIIGSFLMFFCLNCGKNSFKDSDKSVPTEDASKALEEGNSDSAIEILLDDLGSQFKAIYQQMSLLTPTEISTNMAAISSQLVSDGKEDIPAKISILASAHAQKYGIDPLDIALSLATNETGSAAEEGSSNAITILYPILPAATSENKTGLSQSIAILNAIHQSDLTTADFFKKSLFMMANISLITKTFDTSPADGRITLNELSQLESGTTEDLFNLLEAAIGAVSQTDQSGNLATAAEKISGIRNSIAEQSGSDDTEKLKEFLINATNENASNL